MNKEINLSELLGINKGITAVIGSGGKTTLISVLAEELKEKGTVIITTTTKIMPSHKFENFLKSDIEELKTILQNKRVICVAKKYNDIKLCSSNIEMEKLLEIADYVLVEADGSKRLPLKAHIDFEPVIPKDTNKIISVVGLSGINRKIKHSVHRAERFCEINNTNENQIATLEMVARVLNYENLCDVFFINQVDEPKNNEQAKEMCRLLNKKAYYGSLKKGEWYDSSN